LPVQAHTFCGRAWAGGEFVHNYSLIQSRKNSRLTLVGSRCHDCHSKSRQV
jgi:hypothetical protein